MRSSQPLWWHGRCLSIFLLLCMGVNTEEVTASSRSKSFEGLFERGQSLYQKWSDIYALNASAPPKTVPLPDDPVPLAPHLESCTARHAVNRRDDSRRKNGKLPPWASPHGPQPPWISGSDSDNLYLTRRVQTDLWLRHHPEQCTASTLRFLVVKWVDRTGHGLGSAFHIMSMMMSLAMRYNRILVMDPGSFTRADHRGCTGRFSSDFSCYFAPPSPPLCVSTALSRLTSEGSRWGEDLAASSAPSVEICPKCFPYQEHEAAYMWDRPWERSPLSTDQLGVVRRDNLTEKFSSKIGWWRAQSIRYLLRYPSPYLCHLMNLARHRQFGEATAVRVARSLSRTRKPPPNLPPLTRRALAGLGGGELYMPRPIVSIHVRQGDKVQEMRLFSFAAHMWMAERLRMHVPDVANIWLSTEMKSVVERSKTYTSSGWTFHYTENPRQTGALSMHWYEDLDLRNIVEMSLVNLMISSQCDFFIGSLGSNWNRLIDELRSTNGRLKSAYISLNSGEF